MKLILFLKNFLNRLLGEGPGLSSTRFVMVFGSMFIISADTFAIVYCTLKNTELPSGLSELSIGILTILVLGKVAQKWKEVKNDATTDNPDIAPDADKPV